MGTRPRLHPLLLTALLIAVPLGAVRAAPPDHAIPMTHKGASTYYVRGTIAGYGSVEFLVDTGSGYTTISEHTLAILRRSGDATFVRTLTGMLADGTRRVVPVYRIRSITLGRGCVLRDIDAAVFSHRVRPILGLSALEKAAPFLFSTSPPRLVVSNCATS